ncbi:hypothetical protein G7B40_025625 [Aetokthonos hydrillicola Thurmond2011]|jgi:hypothetical protein|uniref:Uncharacterized protein n=1 Tax=Aetokthonos hydrillicola Thurmond2011 TaxID=2712845 RepID=A0AAP5IF91_9CYAN|nr:hypothetical protein [Aetokthonos hydrillicola CCALA 1050]MBW4587703.1 hypothetical protein [Aetokthonos hydrillicola CCALA 1050]MDR9897915.1 hypothetical protein [Aetokthonos hydrillicola Thurmond2011]
MQRLSFETPQMAIPGNLRWASLSCDPSGLSDHTCRRLAVSVRKISLHL